ncbi:hypothetical protein A3C87_00255 [Candidatus Kaiserbacteria bacterium RIFCSPHIGHO2_02_FULL_49_34]|uniref:Uncharacterized protein n=1 Tax=Candidatus Kaiserbacteria bacterium RIFCSPHIGHO2_02_FULL_49_34 TaxID=1798491 RepID=A0A1F6DJ27_9BACT|nr:MAG: hypothetical protein A3C87_00255 [Candidatus Kaiserbacteria bacterium RIFCSPHIGHO2_02_FULL_49_34]
MEAVNVFPGLSILDRHETELFDVETCMLSYNNVDYSVTRIHAKASENPRFLVNLVTCGERIIWSHECSGYPGVALLAMTEGGPVVALCKGERVQRIEPFVDDPDLDDIVERAEAKREAAESIGYQPWFSDYERRAQMLEQEIIRISACENRRRAHVESEEARAALLTRVMRRPYISVTTERNMRVRGIPVRENEWVMLPPSFTAVLVEDLSRPRDTAREVFDVYTDLQGATKRRHVQQVAR